MNSVTELIAQIEAEKMNATINTQTASDSVEKTANEPESKLDYKLSGNIEKAYIVTNDKIYLTVMDEADNFSFAHLENDGIKFEEMIHHNGKNLIPQKLPFHKGEYRKVVGIPQKSLIDRVKTMDTEELFKELTEHMEKYIDASEMDIDMFAYYAMFTWFYPKTNTVAYLRFIADTGKGKSRFLQVISDLCFYPVNMAGASSGNAMMRYNEEWHGTLVVDECDPKGGAEDPLSKYFNLGFERRNSVAKCKPSNFNEMDWFDPFCPKVIAMRKPFEDNATEGRLISITTKETRRKDIPVNLPPSYGKEVERLRALITRWALYNWDKVDGTKLYDCSHLDIENRIKQITVPLSLICQLLPNKEKMLEEFLYRRQAEVKRARSQSMEGMIFNHVYSLAIGEERMGDEFHEFRTEGGLIAVTPTMVSKNLNISTKTIAGYLQSIGMISESNRKEFASGNKKVIRYYAVPDQSTWEEIIQRYWCGDNTPECPQALRSRSFDSFPN
ncbi:hypothetical protein [Methanolobus sp. WCC5]|uniref:hypothetical protein n=1 Tax=Methanolobus sp. WCC5 TaxID=3125785 RepID=UPI00324EC295